jgi:hypothetical protein
MRMRQFVWVAEELAPAVNDIGHVLGLNVCFSDPGVGKFGLENALLPINGNFIEVVAPITEGTAGGRHLARRGGDGGYMIILQCADAAAERERIAATGVREVWRHDGEDVMATHFHPADVPGAILSIDTMHPGSNFHREMSYWKWAGPDWENYVRTDVSQAIAAIDIETDAPDAAAARWGEVLGRAVAAGPKGPEVALDNARLRFVELQDDRGPGIAAIDILPQDRRRIMAAADERGMVTGPDRFDLRGVTVNLV